MRENIPDGKIQFMGQPQERDIGDQTYSANDTGQDHSIAGKGFRFDGLHEGYLYRVESF
jgi:hypothetical protein